MRYHLFTNLKGFLFNSISALFLFLLMHSPSFSQDRLRVHNSPIYQGIRHDLSALVEQAGNKRIVALGEGTHGTKEFNEIRSLLTQKLIEEKGFNYILFESNYGGAFMLNDDLKNGTVNLDSSMKQNLIGIWQTKEIEAFLHWVSDFNKRSSKPIDVGGFDYSELSATLNMVKSKLSSHNFDKKEDILNELEDYIFKQDKIWNSLNKPKFKFDPKNWIKNGTKAYALITTLERQVDKVKIADAELKTALLNLKMGFETIHLFTTQKKDASRDSCMAEMIKSVLRQDTKAKIIIWAHNVHIAKQAVLSVNNGGGMGGFITRAYPNEYFSLATFTGTGNFSATTDPIPTRFNKFSIVKLEPPIDGSFEKTLGEENKVIFLNTDNMFPQKVKMRFIGYGPQSGANTFTDVTPKSLYDAIIYLGKTNAAIHQ